jgi:hypothetical protein
MFMMAFNKNLALLGQRVVDLACGHKALTKNRKKMICPRCTEMLRRSLATGKEDYESFRNGIVRDQMVWEDDPLRFLHESDIEDQLTTK